MKSRKNLIHIPQVLGSLLILVLGMFSLLQSLFVPAIFGDDWIWYVKLPLVDGLPCPSFEPRFLINCLPAVQYALFGFNFTAHRIVTCLLSILVVITLFLLLNQLFPKYILLNLGASMLFLVFPLNNFWQFSDVAAYHTLTYLILFLAFASLIQFGRMKNWWMWILSMILFILCIGLYDTALGLLIVGSIVYFLISHNLERKYRIASLCPALIGIAFVLFRASYQFNTGRAYGYTTERLVLDPLEIISRLYVALRFLVHWAWTHPLIGYLPSLIPRGGHDNLIATGLIIVFLVLLAAVSGLLGRWNSIQRISVQLNNYFHSTFDRPTKDVLLIFLLGLLITGVGFFPIILAMQPTARLELTRLYSLSSVGVCLVIGVIFWLIGYGISQLSIKNGNLTGLIFILLLTPLLIYGMEVKHTIGQNFRQAWNTQKVIWNQFFELAPDFAPKTHVILLMPNYDRILEVAPLNGGYDSFEYALSSFYGNRKLIAAFREADLTSMVFTRNGLIVDPVNYPVSMPYERVVIFRFDQSTNKIEQVKAIPAGMIAEYPDGKPLCESCILSEPVYDSPTRWLVQN